MRATSRNRLNDAQPGWQTDRKATKAGEQQTATAFKPGRKHCQARPSKANPNQTKPKPEPTLVV